MAIERPGWYQYFMAIALVVADRATCPGASVGCVIVRDRRVLVTGYNGSPRGEKHCTEAGCAIVDGHCRRAIHAEVNAVATAARFGVSLDGATAYVTHRCCSYCRGVLKNAGVEDIHEADGAFARGYAEQADA